jgi:DNA-binding CsgD family transcriptional regulator/tetratricopeptide (TPR) repeat protein
LPFASGSPDAILLTMTGRVWVPCARFVGRAEELARLEGALQAAANGIPATVVVGGEAGVGKTRLVQEFAARAQQREARVLVGGCLQLSGGGLPYGPIVEALRGLARDLEPAALRELLGPAHGEFARLMPTLDWPLAGELDRPAGEFGQARLFELLLRFLDRLSAQAPVVLVLEDLHWADHSTLDLLRFLVGMVRRERLLLIATYRSDELHSGHPLRAVLAELDRNRRVEHLELSRLDREEVAELLRGILGGPPPPETLQRVFSQSQGNAFLAEELIAAGGSQASGDLSPRLQALLMAQVARLAEDTRHVLRVTATVGRRAEHGLLAAASQLAEERLLAAVREAVDRQLLVAEQEEAYLFRHVLLREAVYGELLPGERRRLHAAVARALSDDSLAGTQRTAAVELAHHWYAARQYPQALTASIAAAHAAAEVYGFTEAHQQLERALTLWAQVPDAREQAGVAFADLLLEAAEVARWAGVADRAVALTRQAIADVGASMEPAQAGALHARLGDYLWEAGDGKAALAAYEEACRLVADEPLAADKAQVLAAYGAELMRRGQLSASRVRCEEAIAVARSVDARAQEGHAVNTLGCVLAGLGDVEAGIAALRRALALAEEAGTFHDIFRAYANRSAVLASYAGREEEALQVALEGLERLRRLGLELAPPGNVLRGDVAHGLWFLGRWGEAEELTSEALARELPVGFAQGLHLLQGRLQMARGRFDLAQVQGEVAEHLTERLTDPLSHGSLQQYLVELATWRGDYDAGRAAVARGLRHLAESEETLISMRLCNTGLRLEADAAERAYDRHAASELEDIHGRAERLFAHARELVAGLGNRANLPEASAHAAGCEAEFSRLERQSDPERWAAVAAAWDGLSRPYEVAYARWRQAEALLATKAPKAAASVLRQAHEATIHLGEQPLRQEIERLARRARIDLTPPTAIVSKAAPRSAATQHGLTPREQEVLQHLVEGRTNRQIARALFISEKTASVHVSNIMSKLGATNRSEAAAIAHRLHLLEPDA